MKHILVFLILILSGIACKKTGSDIDAGTKNQKFAPNSVVVQMKKGVSIDQVFNFINQYDQRVTYISNNYYTSSLPSDSLQYVLDNLNAKAYTQEPGWNVSGYLHYQTHVIYIFPRLYGMENKQNQSDWLASIKKFKLTELINRPDVGGSIMLFHVPVGKEKEWAGKFRKHSRVDWAEVDYYADIVPL